MNTEWSRPTRYIAGVSLVFLAIFLLYLSRSVIPLLIVAALIAVIVRPVILWLHQRVRLPRGLAVAVVYLVLLILVPLLLLLTIPTIVDTLNYIINLDYQSLYEGFLEWLESTLMWIQAAQLPVGLDTYVDQTVNSLLTNLQQATPAVGIEPPPLATILRSLGSALNATFGAATGLVGAVLSQLATTIFLFLASIYISLGAHTYRESLLRAVPPAYQDEFAILLARIERLWNGFFRGQLTLMLVIGVISWLGLTVLGVPGALYLGITAGLLELIPTLGPIIATIPAIIVALLQGSTYLQVSPLVLVLLVILFYALLQQLENSVIVPRVLGEAVELPALVVMTGVLVGTTVAGILGALLATPVVATGREIVLYVYRKIQGQDPFPEGDAQPKPEDHAAKNQLHTILEWLKRLGRTRVSGPLPRGAKSFPTSSSDLEARDQPQDVQVESDH